MMSIKRRFIDIIKSSEDRFELWSKFIILYKSENICEIGVYKGNFSYKILRECISVKKYFMIDPWQNLKNWTKPANKKTDTFDVFYNETLNKTNFAKEKRVVLRGTTSEVINKIKDDSLDFIYIDGDHTLKGITIDLVNSWQKISKKGFIAGDDFCNSIWQHNINFEPTLVFPFALYFAESMNTKIYALPFNQFLITKEQDGFKFINLTNVEYKDDKILSHIRSKINIRNILIKQFPNMYQLYKNIKLD